MTWRDWLSPGVVALGIAIFTGIGRLLMLFVRARRELDAVNHELIMLRDHEVVLLRDRLARVERYVGLNGQDSRR
jgi:hypothetical protein